MREVPTTVKQSRVLVALVITVMAGTVACSTETGGRAVPDSTGAATTTPEESTSDSVEPTSETNGDLAAVDPCDLLTPSMKTTLGVTGEPQPEKTPSAELCQWSVDKGSIADSFTYGIAVFPRAGIDKVVAVGEKKEITVGSRKAIESLRAGGAVCAISIEVTPTSRVDVQASGGDGAALCAPALEAAELVEPELP